jgi:hypothetical protein
MDSLRDALLAANLDGIPRRMPHSRGSRERRLDAHGNGKQTFSDIEVRFVYESELKGQWFSVVEAFELPVYPNPDHVVVRIEFRDRGDA